MEIKEEKTSATINTRGKSINDDFENRAVAEAIKKSKTDVLVELRF